MQRGELLTVLSLIGLISIIAATGVSLQLTGNVAQNARFYPVPQDAPMVCLTEQIMLKDTPTATVYCCKENMIGQNTCRFPYTIIKAR